MTCLKHLNFSLAFLNDLITCGADFWEVSDGKSPRERVNLFIKRDLKTHPVHVHIFLKVTDDFVSVFPVDLQCVLRELVCERYCLMYAENLHADGYELTSSCCRASARPLS